MATPETLVIGIFPLERGNLRLWQRVLNNPTGLIVQVFDFEPTAETGDDEQLAAVGIDLWNNTLQAQVWTERNVKRGDDPHSIPMKTFRKE